MWLQAVGMLAASRGPAVPWLVALVLLGLGVASRAVERVAQACGSTAMVFTMHLCGTAVSDADIAALLAGVVLNDDPEAVARTQ